MNFMLKYFLSQKVKQKVQKKSFHCANGIFREIAEPFVSTHFFFSILNNAFLHVLMYFLKKNEYLIKYQVNLHSEENKMCVKTFDCSLFF